MLEELGDAKVAQLDDLAVGREEDVIGLDLRKNPSTRRFASMRGIEGTTHIPMRHVILMQVLEPQHELSKVLARDLDLERDRGRAGLDVHDGAARHEFEDEVERVRCGDVDGFV